MAHATDNVLMEAPQMVEALERLAKEVVDGIRDRRRLALVGIHTGGVHLARRIQEIIENRYNLSVPVGALDINLYRDDWTRLHTQPLVRSTHLPFELEGREIVLVDDVLYTGRTVRAALGALADYGRPDHVQLLVLVDRGHRELPICAQFTGVEVETSAEEQVNVLLREKNGIDRIVVERPPSSEGN